MAWDFCAIFFDRDSRLVETNFCYRLKRMYFRLSESFSDDLYEIWVLIQSTLISSIKGGSIIFWYECSQIISRMHYSSLDFLS